MALSVARETGHEADERFKSIAALDRELDNVEVDGAAFAGDNAADHLARASGNIDAEHLAELTGENTEVGPAVDECFAHAGADGLIKIGARGGDDDRK